MILIATEKIKLVSNTSESVWCPRTRRTCARYHNACFEKQIEASHPGCIPFLAQTLKAEYSTATWQSSASARGSDGWPLSWTWLPKDCQINCPAQTYLTRSPCVGLCRSHQSIWSLALWLSYGCGHLHHCATWNTWVTKTATKNIRKRYMYLYQFSLTTTKYQKEKHLFIWIFSQQLSPLILGHVHTPCNGAVRFSVSKWKRNSSLSGNPWVSSIGYLILPTGANSGAEIHEHGLEGSMAGKK